MKSLFNSSILLNEAEYSMGAAFDNRPLSEYSDEEDNQPDQTNQQNNDQNNNANETEQTQQQQDTVQQEEQDTDQEEQDSDQNDDKDNDSDTDNTENMSEEEEDKLLSEPDEFRQSTPKLDILKSLSEEEYRLINYKCYNDFMDLYNKVKDSLDTTLENIVTKNKSQRLVVSKVRDNLNDMIDDINSYILYKFNRSYENNVVAYITFNKRYMIAIDIIKEIIKINLDEKNKDK